MRQKNKISLDEELNLMHNNALYCNAMGNLKYLYQKWFINQKQFLVFQAKASSLQSLGQSVSQVITMVQGSMLLGVGTFLTLIGMMSPSMAGNLIIAKFIGALAIRPTMMIVMATWSSVISVREAVRDLRTFLETSGIPNTSGIKLPRLEGSKLTVSDIILFNRVQTEKILDSVSFL